MARWRIELPLIVAIFADLFGFGMIIAGIQLRAESLVPAHWPIGTVVGALLASTFVIQILVSPHWGGLSDRIGRKPVILWCQGLSAAAMFCYAGPNDLWLLVASRLLSGFGAANVAVAQAQIADAYPAEQRAGPLGRLSAAMSAGLVLGPPLGGHLANLPNGHQMVGWIAGAASVVGVLLIAFLIPAGKPSQSRSPGKKLIIFDLTLLRDYPAVASYATIAAVAWFSLATLEGTFARLIKRLYGYGSGEFGIIFGYESLLAVLIPGVFLLALTNRFSSRGLLRAAYVSQGVGLALNPLGAQFPVWPMGLLLVASTLYAFGSGVANPVINGIVSELTPAERQGELFGVLQGARSIGFIFGPILGGAMFDWLPVAPYFFAGGVCLVAALLVPISHSPTGRHETSTETE